MPCARCQAENREGRRFCAECGAPLSLACPSCGFANETREKFCGGCGTSLTDESATPRPLQTDRCSTQQAQAVALQPPQPKPVHPKRDVASSPCCSVTWWTRPRSPANSTP